MISLDVPSSQGRGRRGADVDLAEVVAVLADEVDLGEVGADAVELEAVQEAQDDQAEVGEDAEEVVAIFINMLHETL